MDPPPYSERSGDASESHPRRASSDEGHDDSAPPAYASLGDNPTSEVATDQKAELLSSSSTLAPPAWDDSAQASSSTSCAASSSQAKTRSPLSLVRNASQAYSDRKKAKEAARKVDYYEKIYGFVPKNVMTKAEWKRAREEAPKVKVPGKLKATTFLMPG